MTSNVGAWRTSTVGGRNSLSFLLASLFWLMAVQGARGTGSESFDVSAAGDQIVFTSTDHDLYLLELPSREASQLTRTSGLEASPAFSPDGTKVVYSFAPPEAHESVIRLLELKDRTTTDLGGEKNCADASPDFSADGGMITFGRAHRWRPYSMGGMVWDDWDVCTMKSDGTELRRVTNQFHRRMGGPRFAANSKSVLFSADADTGNNHSFSALFQANIEGEAGAVVTRLDGKQIANCAAMTSAPDVDHKNDRVVFISDRVKTFEYEVFLTQPIARRSVSRKLTSLKGYLWSPKIAADANVVYFLRNVRGGFFGKDSAELWKVNADGSGQERVAGRELFEKPLSWRGK